MMSCQLWLAMTHHSFFFVSIPSCKSGVEGSTYRLHIQCLVYCLNPVQEVSYSHMLPFAICVFSYIYLYFSGYAIYIYHGTEFVVHFGTPCTCSSFEYSNHIYLYLVHIHALMSLFYVKIQLMY
jgi:hypothetical protein